MPRITVKFFATVRAKTGLSSLEIEVAPDLMEALTEIDNHVGIPLAQGLDQEFTLLVNGRNYLLGDKVLRPNDRLAYVTLTGGG